MKKQRYFSVLLFLLITAIFTVPGCDTGGGSSDEPELAKWAGTWNSMTNYLDEAWLQQTFANGATEQMSAEQLKGMFDQMMAIDFKSCVISGDTFTMYTASEGSGTPTAITYAYKQKFEAGEEDGEMLYWYAFEGNQNGSHKYLIAMPPEQHSAETAVHFHFRYGSDSFQALLNNEQWYPTLAKQGTTQGQIKQSLADVIAGMFGGGGGNDPVWLADVSNPFLGKWESDIPSAGMHLIFDYKADGTFDYEIPGMPAEQGGKGTGGYLVSGNVMVSYLSFEGVAGYTFKVVNNDTINVTEIESVNGDGTFKLGNTAPFTRVAGSAVNKENKPFVLNHPFLGKWNFTAQGMEVPEYGAGRFDIVTNYDVKSNGMLAYDFKVSQSGGSVLMEDTAETPYFIFNDGQRYVLVVYEEGEGFETGTITPGSDNNTIYLTEEGGTPVPLTRIQG